MFSLCEWGKDDVQTWGGSLGQMYRIQVKESDREIKKEKKRKSK